MRKMWILFSLMLALVVVGCASSRYYDLGTVQFEDFDYGFAVKKVAIKNINVALIDEGSGDETLVLVHGLGTNAKAWNQNIAALAESFRVIALDLPGYGKSEKGYFIFSMDFHAEVIAGVLDALNIEKAVLVGHSMGGQIAMTAALNYPDRVSKLVLIAPAGFERFTDGEAAWFKKAVTPTFVKETPIRNIDVNVKSNFYEMPDEAEFLVTERIQMRKADDFELYCYAVAKNVAAMVDGPVYERLEEITQPTLIIFGENDALIPNPYLHGGFTAEIGAIGQEKIDGSTLVMIPECGHLVPMEKPHLTNSLIENFVKE